MSSSAIVKVGVGFIIGGLLKIGLDQMFNARKFGGEVFVSPELESFFNSSSSSKQPHSTIRFTILPRRKPIASRDKLRIGNKFHGSLVVKAEVFTIASSVESELDQEAELTNTIIFDIEMIFSNQTWQVVMEPIPNARISPIVQNMHNDQKMTVDSGDDSGRILLD